MTGTKELATTLTDDELHLLIKEARRRGIAPDELLTHLVRQEIDQRTKPKLRRGNVRPFRRKPD